MHRFGLIGKDISYSFSPGYFGEKFRKLGLEDYTYQIFDLADISEFPALFGEYPDLKGLNVTIPYKQVVMPFLDHIAPEAARIGAVNTICLQGSITTGHNTDVTGFRESLRPLLLPADREALILGTGGASRAVRRASARLALWLQRWRRWRQAVAALAALRPRWLSTARLAWQLLRRRRSCATACSETPR